MVKDELDDLFVCSHCGKAGGIDYERYHDFQRSMKKAKNLIEQAMLLIEQATKK